MNTLANYFYNGGNYGYTGFGYVEDTNSNKYWTLYGEVAIFYGTYNSGVADLVGVPTSPGNLSPLQNVKFNAQFYRCTAGGVPTSKYSGADLITRHDIYTAAKPGSCLGTKFTFSSPILLQDCTDYYCLVWSTEQVTMNYGGATINIAVQNGVTPALQPC